MSLSLTEITQTLENNYAVTDKADGERYILYIYNEHAYLISLD